MKEIRPGIFMITEGSLIPLMKPSVHLYVIAGPNGIVFDAGYGSRSSVRAFVRDFKTIQALCAERGTPFSVKRILPSHSHVDHISGLQGIARALGLEILLTGTMASVMASRRSYIREYDSHQEYAGFVSRSGLRDRVYRMIYPLVLLYYKFLYGIHFISGGATPIRESGTIDVNGRPWMILPTPGHCRDHISLFDPETGILFGGDNVLNSVTTWLGPPSSDMGSYMATLESISALPGLKEILPAHGKPVEEPRKRIRELIAWRELRIDHVLAAVRRHEGITVGEIIGQLYPGESIMKRFLAEGWIVLTLMHLEQEGSVERRREGVRIRYFPREDAVG